ncbi:hypothetical protein F5B21DRAFT_390545 [Xylaria acuta]|nr:hypothetical protein F5B21DRAFT_390545 [Xylaria acuta]
MDDTRPLKLLSLDGGGIRGLSSLIILKHLMQLVDPEKPPRPCDYFDLIGGTSTGGLIALMLGRLQMEVDECIRKYLEVASAAFQPKRSRANIVGRAKGFLKAEGAYRGDQLAAEFKKAALAFEGNEDAKLLRQDSPCKAFVCSFEKALNTLKLFRTYATEATRKSVVPNDCMIWEAARATSAASTFFDPVLISQQSYVDGATGFNNPVETVIEEARAIWPDALSRIESVVSIGTGVPEPKDFGDDLKGIVLTLKAIATETEQTHLRFLKNHEDLGLRGRYFRFNVNRGLVGVELDDHAKVGTIEAATRLYLDSPETQSIASSFAAVLPPKLDFIRSEDRNRILGWLQCSDQWNFYNEASILRRNDKAGDWFIKGHFNAWQRDPGSLLWLYASAGSGKTVLTSKVIECIEEQGCDLLAYYYFSFQHREQHTMRDFKTALLVQFVKQLSQKTHAKNPKLFFMPRSFKDLRDKYYPSSSPRIADLYTTLLGIIDQSPRTFIVIDALDECTNSQLQSDVLAFAQQLLENATTDLYILITSRPEVDIELAVSRMPVVKRRVAFDTQKVDDDIRSHLISLTGELPYSKWSGKLRKHVVNYITQRSGGIFRWADLQIQALRGKPREVDVNRALQNLPKNLSETYKRMLDRIEFECYREEAVAVLRWLSYAQSPLSLAQIAEIAAFDVRATNIQNLSPASDQYDVTFLPQNRFDDPREIYRILSGLITVTGSFESSTAGELVVSFSHFSVREYLGSNEASEPFKLYADDCNWFIYKSCLAYIESYDSSHHGDPFKPTHPLLWYACLRLWNHVEELLCCSEADENKESVTHAIEKRFQPLLYESGYAGGLALRCAGINLPSTSMTADRFIKSPGLSHPLTTKHFHIAISTADSQLLECLSHAGIHMTGDALIWAVKGYTDRGEVSPDFESTSRRYPLTSKLISAFQNQTATDTHLPPPFTTDPTLDDHSISKRKSVWELLLMNPIVDPNATNSEQQTPLLLAALLGDEPFFRFLHELKDVNHDHRDLHGWGLATCAFIGGDKDIIALVLNRAGVDLVSLDRYGWSPLEWATYRGLHTLVAPFIHPSAKKPDNSLSQEDFIVFKEFKKHRYGSVEVWDVNFSHNGLYLAVSLSNGECLIHDALSMVAILSLQGHQDGIGHTSWSPDDTLITTCCRDCRARVFLAKSGELIAVIEFDDPPARCAWLPDGGSFIIGSLDEKKTLSRYSVTRHEIKAGNTIRVGKLSYNSFPERVEDVAVSPDGQFIVAMGLSHGAGSLYVYKTDTTSLEYRIDIPRGVNVAVDNASRRILLGLQSGGHKILDIANGTVLHDFPAATIATEFVLRSTFGGPNASWVLRPEEDGYISIWDCDSPRLLGHAAGHYPERTNCISWRPGGGYKFASGGDDGVVRIWSRSEVVGASALPKDP